MKQLMSRDHFMQRNAQYHHSSCETTQDYDHIYLERVPV
jgi:hypothetical protein